VATKRPIQTLPTDVATGVGAWLSPVPIRAGLEQKGRDCYRELRRIPIPRTWVNKGIKGAGAAKSPGPGGCSG
jgi:hypothetical protein